MASAVHAAVPLREEGIRFPVLPRSRRRLPVARPELAVASPIFDDVGSPTGSKPVLGRAQPAFHRADTSNIQAPSEASACQSGGATSLHKSKLYVDLHTCATLIPRTLHSDPFGKLFLQKRLRFCNEKSPAFYDAGLQGKLGWRATVIPRYPKRRQGAC